MEERSIILINGQPGSGKSTLGRGLARRYHDRFEQERAHHLLHPGSKPDTSHPLAAHISLGQYVRDIYAGETESYYAAQVKEHLDSTAPYDLLDDTLANCLTLEAFLYHGDAKLVFLDGYPRRAAQVDDLRTMSGDLGYNLRGMVVSDVETDIAKARCLKRDRGLGKSALTSGPSHPLQAEKIVEQRFRTYHENTPGMIEVIQKQNLPVEYVPTGGLKDKTLRLGEAAVERLLGRGDIRQALA